MANQNDDGEADKVPSNECVRSYFGGNWTRLKKIGFHHANMPKPLRDPGSHQISGQKNLPGLLLCDSQGEYRRKRNALPAREGLKPLPQIPPKDVRRFRVSDGTKHQPGPLFRGGLPREKSQSERQDRERLFSSLLIQPAEGNYLPRQHGHIPPRHQQLQFSYLLQFLNGMVIARKFMGMLLV